jgi:hypothetical protein
MLTDEPRCNVQLSFGQEKETGEYPAMTVTNLADIRTCYLHSENLDLGLCTTALCEIERHIVKAIIALKEVPPARMHSSQGFYHFLNGSWKLCFVRVFSTAYESASITSIMLYWRLFSFILERENREK